MGDCKITCVPDYLRQPPAWFHTRILVGPGAFLTPRFVAENQIGHVINCAGDDDSPQWFRKKYPHNYVCLNAIDNVYVDILYWYPTFETMMLNFLRQGNGVVYVHCQAGMNRSGSLALAYVCKHYHLPFDEMVKAVRSQRSVLLQNLVFMNQVKEFINGRVPSEKDTRVDSDGSDDGDIGLSSPDDCSGSEGVQDDARDVEE